MKLTADSAADVDENTRYKLPDRNDNESERETMWIDTEKQLDQEKEACPQLPAWPVDRGWAWFVMLGAFINTTSTIVFLRSISMFFVAYLDKYQVSATLTTLAFGLCAFTFAASSLLQPLVFLPRFSERSLSLIGSFINIIGTISLAFSPNIVTFNIFVATIGFSWGFILISSMALLGKYFKKRLSLAVSVANVGYSIATISGPSLTQYLLATYGLEGGVMLLAGLNMQLLVGSMLLRPTSFYTSGDSNVDQVNTEVSSVDDGENECQVRKDSILHPSDAEYLTSQRHNRATASAAALFSSLEGKNYLVPPQTTLRPAFSDRLIDRHKHTTDGRIGGLLDAISMSSGMKYLSSSSLHLTTNAFHHHKSMQSIPSDLLRRKQESNLLTPDSRMSRLRQSCSSSIYGNPYAVMLVLASGVGIHAQAYYGYTPVLGLENGLTDAEIPLLLTIAGVCDLISKLTVGFVTDLACVRRIYVAISTQAAIGVLLQLVSVFQGFRLMAVLQVFGGAFVQCFFNLLPAITADLLGPHYIAHVMSAYFLVNGLVQTVDHILVGVFKDLTDSFHPAYTYLGGLYLLGGAILCLEPILRRKARRTKWKGDQVV